MGYFFNTSDINQTFVIEPLSLTGGTPTVSACTAVFTNNVVSCDYNTTIFLGDGIINFTGDLYTNDNLTASTINASTYYSGGTNLINIINQNGVVSGSFSNSADTLTLTKADATNIYVTGFTDYYTTGATLIGNTVYFDRNDTLSAYTVNLSKYTADTYVTGVSFTDNQIIITRNDNFSTSAFINTMTGLTINGLLSSSSISASSISVINLYTNSITALTLTSNTINVNNLNANTISATTYQNLPIDIRTTGATYSNNTFTYTNNTGGTFNVLFNTLTGLTVNGDLISNTISATTYYGNGSGLTNIPISGVSNLESNLNNKFDKSGGTISGNTTIIGTLSATTYDNLPKISNIINVGNGIGNAVEFTSIKAAVDSINDSGEFNRYVIKVAAGVYIEDEINLDGKEFISIVGSDILQTLVLAASPNQNIFSLGNNNELSFMTISGATNGVALSCVNIGGFALVHKISIYDCDTNVLVYSDSADTTFYGEFMDFNGLYTYGTKIVSLNGYTAYANQENYYNYPTGVNNVIANHIQGSGATLSVFVGDGISNGATGSTNYLLFDYAELYTISTTADGWGYGIRNTNIGGPCRFDVDSYSIVDSIYYDLSVERVGTFGTYGGSSTHTKINNVSDSIYWAFLDTVDGEFEVTRKISVTFQDGTHTDASTLIFEGSTMGLISGGVITGNGLTITVSPGFGYLEKTTAQEVYARLDWSATTLTLPSNQENYIYFNENTILSYNSGIPDNTTNIILGRVVTDLSTIAFIDQSPYNASHTSNLLSTFNRNALGPVYATGSIVTENLTPFKLNVTQGQYYFSENEFSPAGGTGITFTQYYINGSGTWAKSATTFVNNAKYNSGTTLTSLSTSAYTKHTLYVVGQGINEKYFLVLGQNEYSTLIQTENADLPTPPTYFDDAVTPIASIYIQQGNPNIIEIEDIRPVIGFKAGGVNASSLHANLLGLNSDDHKQYLLVDGSRAMTGNLSIGGNNIVSAGTINNVTIETHASRHKHGGADEVSTSTPGPNEIPKSDTYGKLDTWISDSSNTVKGLTQLSVNPVSTPIAVGANDNRFLNSFTGGTFINSASTITFTTVSGGTFNVTGITTSTPFTGGTVTGSTIYTNGLTANTISATTYQNLPISGLTGGQNISITGSNGNYTVSFTGTTGSNFTGGTVTGATIYTNGLTANTLNITGFTLLDGTTATTISATTITAGTISASNYLNLPYPNYITTGSSGTYSLKTTNGTGNDATANYAISFGQGTIASGISSHAEGYQSTSGGDYSHAEGWNGKALGIASHAEGSGTTASGIYSHAEGVLTISIGFASHAEGISTNAFGDYSHAEGISTTAYTQSHAEGNSTEAIGQVSHAEGLFTIASGISSHAEGQLTIAIGDLSHVEGNSTTAIGFASHAEGNETTANGNVSHAEGSVTKALGLGSHAEGSGTTASGAYSHAEGDNTKATGTSSHAEGSYTTAGGRYSYVMGYQSSAIGNLSFVHGSGSTATGMGTMVFGNNITGTENNAAYFERGRFIGTGTTTPILQVSGSVGTLLQVKDELTADIFNVVDSNTNSIFQVFSGDVVTMGKNTYASYNTTTGTTISSTGFTKIISIPTFYNNILNIDSVFVDYSLKSPSGARAGNVMVIQSGTSIQYTETSTNDIGNTSDVIFSANSDSVYINLYTSAGTTGWTIKTIVRAI